MIPQLSKFYQNHGGFLTVFRPAGARVYTDQGEFCQGRVCPEFTLSRQICRTRQTIRMGLKAHKNSKIGQTCIFGGFSPCTTNPFLPSPPLHCPPFLLFPSVFLPSLPNILSSPFLTSPFTFLSARTLAALRLPFLPAAFPSYFIPFPFPLPSVPPIPLSLYRVATSYSSSDALK